MVRASIRLVSRSDVASERGLLRQAPGLAWVPYLGAGLLLPVAWIAMEKDALQGMIIGH